MFIDFKLKLSSKNNSNKTYIILAFINFLFNFKDPIGLQRQNLSMLLKMQFLWNPNLQFYSVLSGSHCPVVALLLLKISYHVTRFFEISFPSNEIVIISGLHWI